VFAPLDAWLREHLYPVVFLGALVDASGIPFPGRIMLITVGSLSGPAEAEGASAAMLIAVATIGTVAGDHVWYLVGRLRGRRLFDVYFRWMRLPRARIAAADRFLRRFGGLSVILARLSATLRIVVVPLAVSRGMSYGRFLAFEVAGALLWTAGFVSLGRAAGALGARTGLVGTVTIISALAAGSVAMSLMARRRLGDRVSVS
jgi:membrane protein DedA with SNARE-associated domain